MTLAAELQNKRAFPLKGFFRLGFLSDLALTLESDVISVEKKMLIMLMYPYLEERPLVLMTHLLI